MQSKAFKHFFRVFLWCFFLLTTAKILFVGYDIDEQYAVALSWRFVQGDFPLLTMWEPHQTSCFPAAFLMILWIRLTGSTTGIVLYLRVCGLLLHLLVNGLLYRYLARRLDREAAWLLTVLSFFTLPKLMFLPEFSNLQIWFLLLMILCLLQYYHSDRAGASFWYLTGAGAALAMEVLSYPSTVLVFPVCLSFLFRYRLNMRLLWKELAALILPCIGGAGCFLGWLLSRLSVSQLLALIPKAARDGSHSAALAERLAAGGSSLLAICGFLTIYGIVTAVLYYSMRHRGRQAKPSLLFLLCTLTGQMLLWIFGDKYPNYPMVEYFLLPALLLYAVLRKKVSSSPELSFFVVVPLAAFCGILLFTNHPLIVSAPFLGPCVIGILSLPEMEEWWRSGRGDKPEKCAEGGGLSIRTTLIVWVMVLMFGKCYMIRTTGGLHYTCFDSLSLMRQGPAAGILADTAAVCRYRDSLALVKEVLPPGARVFYAGTCNDLYLMQDLEFCTPSTISSPTFDDKITDYFTLNPDKQPEYLVCDIRALSDSWVVSYLQSWCEPEPMGENDYLQIYRVATGQKVITPL